MESKKFWWQEPLFTPRIQVISLSLLVAAYLILFTILLQKNSIPPSKVKIFITPSCSSSSSSSSSTTTTTVSSVNKTGSSGIRGSTHLRNFTHNVKNSSLHVGENHTTVIKKPIFFDSNGVNTTLNASHKAMEAESVRNSSLGIEIHNVAEKTKNIGLLQEEKCDIFDGKWVRDESKPYYPLGSCPHIDRDFNCHLNGRPDTEYVKLKWQPNGCDIPSLNATDFLERLRGQRLVFVGDSLNRNMWESMVCIFRQSIRNKKRVYEISGKTEFKKRGVYAFRFEDYNCSVDFVASPFLVRQSSFKGKNGTSFETLRLDLMDKTTSTYHDADIIVFNTGHWWTHEKTSRGEEYYQEGNHVHPRLEVQDAYRRALNTWAKWVDRNIDANRTQIFFRGYSMIHFRGGQWNSGGQCHKETEPIYNETYLQKYPPKMKVLEEVIQRMKIPVMYMNISRLTDYRKDGHPSVYRMGYKSEAESNSSERLQDCSHWCLPGVPDTWNELLYAFLLQTGKGNWRTKPS